MLSDAPVIAFDEALTTAGDRSSLSASEPMASEPMALRAVTPVVEELVVKSLGELWDMMEFDGPPDRGAV